jgi:hypothetical protein
MATSDLEARVARIEKHLSSFKPLTDTIPPTPKPTDPNPPSSGKVLDILPDLKNWTIMVPAFKSGSTTSPDNNYPAKILNRYPQFLYVENGGVVFRAPANGAHSPNSKYCRTEAREMADTNWTKAAWTSAGPRSLECDLAIDTSHLTARRRINGMQIHDGGDDVCQIMFHETDGLGLMHKDGQAWESIDPEYDGQRFTCKIEVDEDALGVFYNGTLAVAVPKKGTGWYWKLGCYNQSGGASEYKEPETAYGKVTVWGFKATS